MAYTNQLVSAGDDRTIRIWNVDSDQPVRTIHAGRARMMSMIVTRDGTIAAGGSDNVIRLWNAESGAPITQLTGHTGTVAAFAFDGTNLYSGGFDTTVRVWSRAAGSLDATRTVQSPTGNTTSPR